MEKARTKHIQSINNQEEQARTEQLNACLHNNNARTEQLYACFHNNVCYMICFTMFKVKSKIITLTLNSTIRMGSLINMFTIHLCAC